MRRSWVPVLLAAFVLSGTCVSGGASMVARGGAGTATAQLLSTTFTTTSIHNAAHQAVAVVQVGTTVHDFVTVSSAAGVPTGNVNFDWFLNAGCSGGAAANSGSVGPLNGAGQFDATAFAFTVSSPGFRAFKAHYEGAGSFDPSDGPCESLQVVDANIQLTPPTATNPVATNHVLTCHVNVNDGNGFVNATAGTVCTGSLPSGPGSFVGSNQCTTVAATGDCQLTITSGTAGQTTIRASTDVTVAGVTLHRETGDGHPGDSPDAQKTWVATTFTTTSIHNAAHQAVAVVQVGTTVHDFVTVSSAAGVPTGNVNIDWFLNAGCSGGPAANSGSVGPLNGAGQFDATAFAFTVSSPGFRAFKAHYEGAGGFEPSDGPCESLRVVDANIQLTPPTATNPVASNHVLTCHVNVNDGNGFVNASAGTACTGSIQSGPGSFVGSNQCTTVAATGDCQLTITSAVTGQTTVRASTDVTVAGASVHRETGDGHPGDSPDAQKLWVNAAIVIAPNATNEVGQSHTFTATVLADTGSGLAPVGAGEAVTVTLAPANGAAPVPAGPFNLVTNAAGQVQVTFTSATAGTVAGHAAATVVVNGVSIHVETDGVAPNSGDAVKTFVDANIQLAPPTATNPVATNHVLTCHINIDDGGGSGFVSAPAGTACTGSIQSGPGSFVGSNQCTTVGTSGDCQLTITSGATGPTTIRASTNVTVGGVTLHRETGDGHPGDSPDAQKLWTGGASIAIAPNATNEVGYPHTFTVTLQKTEGGVFVPAVDEQVTVTLTPSNGANPTPAGPFVVSTNAAGQVTVTFSSQTAGRVAGHAAATVVVDGVPIHVETDGVAPNSGDAVKTFVDANIQLAPLTATNQPGTNHVLTCHINIDDGSGSGFVSAPAGTACTGSIQSGPGSFVGSNQCTTVGTTGDCQLTITSAVSGVTVVSAQVAASVGGVVVVRATGDGKTGDSANAVKEWNTPPSATVSSGQCSSTNLASGAINLTLSDPDGDPLTLTLGSNSNPALVPNANIVLGGAGNNRTLAIVAEPRAGGLAVITLNLSDGLSTVPVVVTVVVGTNRDETLNGTGGTDMMFGLGGKNTVNGLAGNDLLCGGNSSDTLNGGDGNDILDGQNGSDLLIGGAGNDILRGNLGGDTLTGGSGADFFSGGPGNDVATDFNVADGDTQDGTIP